eukprot:gene10054-2478_t
MNELIDKINKNNLKQEIVELSTKLNHYQKKVGSLEISKDETLDDVTIYGSQLDFFSPFFVKGKRRNCLYTLTSQLSLPRINRVSMQLKNWSECISIALHINIKDFERKFKNSLKLVRNMIKNEFNDIYENVDIHLHISEYYKINTLRSFSLKYSPTELVVILDIDWILSSNILENLRKFGPPKRKSIYALMTLYWNCTKTCFYPYGQHLLDYERWRKSEDMYEIGLGFPFEPYIIGYKSEFPEFSKRFDFGGNDKVSFMYEISLMKFKCYVMPKVYVAHYPHEKIEHWGTRSYERAVEQWSFFIKELQQKFPNEKIINQYKKK